MAGSVRLSFRREGFLLVVAFTASVVIALGNTGKCWLHEFPWRFHKVTKHFLKVTTTKPNVNMKVSVTESNTIHRRYSTQNTTFSMTDGISTL